MRRVVDPQVVKSRPPMTQADVAKRHLFIEELLIYATPHDRIIALACRPIGPTIKDPKNPWFGRLEDGNAPGLGITEETCLALITTVRHELAKRAEARKHTCKADAEERLIGLAREARKARAYGAANAAESLLATIQGTKTPLRVEHTVTMSASVGAVLSGMSAEDLEALAHEYDDLALKATGGPPAVLQIPKVYSILGSKGNHYEVTLKDGVYECPCEDFKYRGHLRPCRHIESAKASSPTQTGLRARG